MIFSTPIYAAEHERFAPDVQLPAPGTLTTFKYPGRSGKRVPATIIAAQRSSPWRLMLTLHIADEWRATCGGCGWPIAWAWHKTVSGQQCRNCQPQLTR